MKSTSRMFKFWEVLLLSVLPFIAILSCTSQGDSASQMKNPPKHVIMIGFDGLSAHSLNNGAEMPTFRRLMEQGSYTTEARSVLPSSSAVNWASMFMGAGPELHGFTTWGSQKPDLPSRELTANGLFPDIFAMIRQKQPNSELGFLYEWGGMRYLADTLSIDHVESVNLSGKDVTESVAPAVRYIQENKPNFCAVIFAEPDGAGHSKGWESEEYYTTLTHLDKGLKAIVDAVDQAGMLDETVFVLTSDHGGIKTGHGGKTMQEMQVPLVFSGKGICPGKKIEESVMIFDVASTIGYMFGIDQPQVWIGRPIKSIFQTN